MKYYRAFRRHGGVKVRTMVRLTLRRKVCRHYVVRNLCLRCGADKFDRMD